MTIDLSESAGTRLNKDFEAFLEYSLFATDHKDLTQHLLAITQQFGVEHVTYLEFRKFGEFLIPLVARGSLPLAFGDRFLLEAQYKIDPFMKRASGDPLPFTWGDALEGQLMTESLQQFLKDCAKYGMLNGYFIPYQGARCSVRMVGYTGEIKLGTIERALLLSCALYYRVAISRLSSFEHIKPVAGTLTPRQLQCAELIAQGKTDREIAAALSLSEATVNRHVELAKENLGVGTRIQVVVRALRSGQLKIADHPTEVVVSILSEQKKILKLK